MNEIYQVLIAWSQEDGAYVAQVPDLPGCFAHGETKVAALASARAARERRGPDAERRNQGSFGTREGRRLHCPYPPPPPLAACTVTRTCGGSTARTRNPGGGSTASGVT